MYSTYIYIYNYKYIWLVVSTSLKNISQLGLLLPIYRKIKKNPNHQADIYSITPPALVSHILRPSPLRVVLLAPEQRLGHGADHLHSLRGLVGLQDRLQPVATALPQRGRARVAGDGEDGYDIYIYII